MGFESKIKVKGFFNLKADDVSDDFLLKKIHLKRLKQSLPDYCAEYLLVKYQSTNDVRFFNELLWVTKNEDVLTDSKRIFKKQFDKKGNYKFCYDESFLGSLKTKSDNVKVDETCFYDKEILLIGSPFHFFIAYRRLKKMNAKIDVANVKYHPNKKIRFLFNNKITSLLYKLYFGSKNYYEIDIKDKSELKNIQLKKKYDVGFHKLSFIISDKLINQFKQGLINDHWGSLPLFKGRSTLEYSKLFGASITLTNHLVKREIDSGSIILFTTISPEKIKKKIYLGLSERIVKSVALLCVGKLHDDIDNTKGKVFYEMHPWLSKYVKNI
jgi:folate-dependent phosphoribosylglycinamide formyltransferase PurN